MAIEIEEQDKFGIVLILPECSFTADLHRGAIPEMMKDIDEKLTEQGAPEGPETRCAMMVHKALVLSHMIACKEMDKASGVTDIAYSFLYAFGKQIGFDNMESLRGVTGSFLRNILNLNPCLNEIDFEQQTNFLKRKIREHDERGDDIWDYDLSEGPTLH